MKNRQILPTVREMKSAEQKYFSLTATFFGCNDFELRDTYKPFSFLGQKSFASGASRFSE